MKTFFSSSRLNNAAERRVGARGLHDFLGNRGFCRPGALTGRVFPRLPKRNGNSERGVALVITLIFLSVITFMAVTFLVVSRREAEQVDYLTQQTTAKQAAASGTDSAIARLTAKMLSAVNIAADGTVTRTVNGYDFGLEVSTNYNTETNFSRILAGRSITNVGYYANYDNRVLVSGNDYLAMLNNQLILPRPPVFINNSPSLTTPAEFRYYLDLNRNGVFEPSGLQLQRYNGRPILTQNNLQVYDMVVGDPQYVGILDHPDQFHSASNYYIGRVAWIAMPIGNSLDINYIHNDAKFLVTPGPGAPYGDGSDDGFVRNQGVGPWELNLAGFLNSLNTNTYAWGAGADINNSSSYYNYRTSASLPSLGKAFTDAASILHYRYGGSLTNLGGLGVTLPAFRQITNYVDLFGAGLLMTGSTPQNNYINFANNFWAGSESPNVFATTQDPFNLVNNSLSPATRPSFATNLWYVGTLTNTTYDRYTYYRMLSQLSLGSAPESSGKLNLNYANAGTNVTSTNFVPWTPAQFFTNAAIRLIQARPEFAMQNLCSSNRIYIPIYPTNYYTPAVHRLLQLSANIYDATTNKSGNPAPYDFDYPSVFAPQFTNETVRLPNGTTYKNYYICGYQLATPFYVNKWMASDSAHFANDVYDLRRTGASQYSRRDDLSLFSAAVNNGTSPNVYGIPLVVGAKKGFPNINSFTMVPEIQMQRKMQVVKNAANPTSHALWQTNVQYILGISNSFGVSCWNSYTNLIYPRSVKITVSDEVTMAMTNQLKQIVAYTNVILYNQVVIDTNGVSHWSGSPKDLSQNTVQNSFKAVLSANVVLLGDSVLSSSAPYAPIRTSTSATLPILPNPTRNFIPQYGLLVTNRVRVMMQDARSGQIIDYVQLGGLGQQPGLDTFDDLNWDLIAQDNLPGKDASYWFWQTNSVRPGNPLPVGFFNQLTISQRIPPDPIWRTIYMQGIPDSVTTEITGFNNFLNGSDTTSTSNQVPYTPIAHFTNTYTWSANDPLVHFLASDLLDMNTYQITNTISNSISGPVLTGGPLIWSTNTVGVPAPNKWGTNDLLDLSLNINYKRYQPWGLSAPIINPNPNLPVTKVNLAFKDPLITRSDDWQFLANDFPNAGWLGRVHRGTPWQTVYLKSAPLAATPAVGLAAWQRWTGDVPSSLLITTNYYTNFNTGAVTPVIISDAAVSQPVNDWELMDLFTTAPMPGASRGRLSVNQTNIAAWAAVFDGVIVQTNNGATNIGPTYIDPANAAVVSLTNGAAVTTVRVNSLRYLVDSINAQRNTMFGRVFTNLGDILSVPALTVASPFLDPTKIPSVNTGINWDAAYERIPQQVMSLLTVGTPRYVIYSYGQSLKPAPNSIVTSGPYFGTCTNYVITGETVTRTIVRFDDPLYSGLNPPVPAMNAPNPVVPGQPLVPGMQLRLGQRAVRPVIESVQVLAPE